MLSKRRGNWKKLRPLPAKARKHQKPVLSAYKDLIFTCSFGITGRERWRMKAFFRRNNVDFFAVSERRKELEDSIVSRREWDYYQVFYSELEDFEFLSHLERKRKVLWFEQMLRRSWKSALKTVAKLVYWISRAETTFTYV